MKRLILLISTIILTLPLFGDPIDETTAKQLAQNFWKENNIMGVKGDKVFKKKMGDARFVNVAPQCGYSEFFIFNNEDGKGFVIIAADDCVTPILGYSYDNNFTTENLPPNLKGWLDGYAEQIRMAVEMKAMATDEIRADWECLRRGKNLPIKSETAVNPLLSTAWGQGDYYNAQCPSLLGTHTPTGCVATAMAQIMKYWNYPTHGYGFHSYQCWPYGTLLANFGGTNYQWNSMPNNVTSPNNAVATLMYHCGVSVEMDYGINGSSAYVISYDDFEGYHEFCAENALKSYFGYSSNNIQGLQRSHHESNWISLLKNELNNNRPILYRGGGPDGGGHAFVCDGYNNNNYFHFNWGWDGLGQGTNNNAYYSIDNLNPTVNQHTYNFSYDQQAIIGIQPDSNLQSYDLVLYDDVQMVGDVYGNYGFGQNISAYAEILNNGNSTFNGYIAAAVFDNDYYFIDFLGGGSATIEPNYWTGGTVEHDGGIPFLPSYDYLYHTIMFYSTNGENWTIVNSGNYSNDGVFQVLNNGEDIETNSSITFSNGEDDVLFNGQSITINVEVLNQGTYTYNKSIWLALLDSDENYIQIIDDLSVNIPVNGSVSLNYTDIITAPEGQYYLALLYYDSENYVRYVGSVFYSSIRRVYVINPTYSINATSNPNDGGSISFTGELSYNFDNGFNGWTSIDADGDGYNWKTGNEMMGTGYGHNGSNDLVLSQSYDNYSGVLYPDNYLVSPQVALGGSISFWACAQDNAYPSEHFGVAVSTTSNTNASSFTTIQEWTMTAKGEGSYSNHSRDGISRAQGNWYQYTVDLSAYSGQTGYIAIRHFNCSDMFYLDIDDVSITTIGGNTYYQGQTCTVSATANNGYTFVKWTENGTQVSTNANYTFTVTGNRNLVAHFQSQQQQYTVNVSSNPNNGGNVTGGGSYNQGATCTVHATANNGFTFTNWTENGTQVSTNANYSFTVTGNRNLVANFAQNTHAIQASAGSNGIITPSGTVTVAHGANQSFAMIPDDGFEVQDVYIDGNSVGPMTSYTFTNVTADHYIHVTFVHADGIGESNDISIIIYPNPTQGEIIVEGEGLSHVRIVNAYGQMVYNAKVESNQVRIDLSQMAQGIYMMHIEADGGQAVRKIVVE